MERDPSPSAISALRPSDAHVPVTHVEAVRDVALSWTYDFNRDERLAALHHRARTPAWQVDDLDWASPPPGRLVRPVVRELSRVRPRSPFGQLDADGWDRYDALSFQFSMSQLLHGEQLAVLCSGAVLEVAPSWDAKAFAATQALDEVRHVEAISQYLCSRFDGPRAVNDQMAGLFADVLTSRSWDLVYLGMQVMVEGMGLAALGALEEQSADPLLHTMLRNVIRDEARHVAFGVNALQHAYADMTTAEIKVRQEFVVTATHALRGRLIPVPVFEELELPVREATRLLLLSPSHRQSERRMFRHILPICARIGLLDANDGWLRGELDKLGVTQQPTVGTTDDDALGAELSGPGS